MFRAPLVSRVVDTHGTDWPSWGPLLVVVPFLVRPAVAEPEVIWLVFKFLTSLRALLRCQSWHEVARGQPSDECTGPCLGPSSDVSELVQNEGKTVRVYNYIRGLYAL